ncbi:hypothetical protein TIFTF001_028483 [Ficus carica]|uniref:Uncharacterized protein n=1 Tax=Ficus carica TaxID=3494 RepID=A0AA88DQ01_FICCA|nr:hypothetical protein TIFTF001_028483 [Ficus carica]
MSSNYRRREEIDNYLERGKVSGRERGDSEETVSEALHHVFTAVSYALVSSDHGLGGKTSRGTSDFFPSMISKKAMEKSFVEAKINGDNFHCILPQPMSNTEKVTTLIEGILNSSHEWKTKFFFLGGRYQVHPANKPEPIGVWSKFRPLVPSPPRSVLDVDSLCRINMIFALPPEERHRKSLITTENLRERVFLQNPLKVGSKHRCKEPITVEGDQPISRSQGVGEVIEQHLRAPLASPTLPILPGLRILDPNFIILDIPEVITGHFVKLPLCFSLAFQAIYEWFHEKDWKAAESMPLLKRLRQQIHHQLSALEISIMNYIEIATLIQRDTEAEKAVGDQILDKIHQKRRKFNTNFLEEESDDEDDSEDDCKDDDDDDKSAGNVEGVGNGDGEEV